MLPVADAHNDLLLACLHRRERGVQDPFGDDWLPGLRSGGVAFQVLPMFTEDQFIGEAALRRTLELIELAHEIATLHRDDVALVTTAGELDEALAGGRIALLLALEGAEPIGSSISLIETMWRLGVRMASLTWNRRTMLADGIAEQETGGRLSSLGVEAITEMERLQTMAVSPVRGKYDIAVDRQSAFEMLKARADAAAKAAAEADTREAELDEALREFKAGRRYSPAEIDQPAAPRKSSRSSKSDPTLTEQMTKMVMKELTGTTGRRIVRGILGGLFKDR